MRDRVWSWKGQRPPSGLRSVLDTRVPWERVEWTGFLMAALLVGTGLLFVRQMAASDIEFGRDGIRFMGHVKKLAVAMPVFFLGFFVRPRWLRRHAWLFYAGAIVLLLLVPVIGEERNNARRWIPIPGLGFDLQPSELAKVAVVVWTAAVAIRKQDEFLSLRRGLAPFLLVWVALIVPIALEPDLSTALLVGMMGCLIVYVAGARLTHFLFLGLLAVPVLYTQLDVAFRARRMVSYLDPSSDPAGAGFQVHQSLLAFGSGGVAGVGFGQGRQKLGFLPEAHNDFIFAMIGEEWGLLGAIATVLLYLLLVLVGFRVAARAPDLFGQLLAVGLTSMIAMQAILHMAVGLGLVPATGLALPLISYGRSNLLVTLASLGMLMSISRASERPLPVGRRARA